MTATETPPSRSQTRERHPRRLTAPTVPCRSHRGRVTPKATVHRPTSHRYCGSKSSHVHLPRRDCPVRFGDDQKWRACSCGQLKAGRTQAEVDAWWHRHRKGLPEPEPQPEQQEGRLRRGWRAVSRRAVGVSAWLHRDGVREPVRLVTEVRGRAARAVRSFHRAPTHAATVALAFDALRLRPHGHVTVSNSVNQFGRRCLDPAKGFALRRNVRTVSFEDRAGEHIELIRTRRNGCAGWVAVTGDKFDGRFFPTISGGAGVDLFFRAAGTTWASTTSWSTTSGGGSAGVAPAATDRAIFEAASAACSIGAAAVCRSLDATAGTGNYASTISGAGSNLSIGDGTAAIGNKAFVLIGSMSWTMNATIVFQSTNATQQTISCAGKSVASVNFSTTTASYQLVDALSLTASWVQTSGSCIVDTNGQSVTISSNLSVTAGTLTCGASVFTCSGTTVNCTPTTLNANISEFKMTGAGTTTFTGTGKSFYKVTYDVSASASKTNVLSIAGDFTVTNTFKVGGNAVAGNNANRPLVQSSVLGTTRTLTGTGGTFTMTGDVDFSDITVSGSPTFSNPSSCFVGDCQGNSTYLTCTTDGGTNGTARTTQTSTGTASFTWSTHGWTSRVPLPQDDVSIPNAFVASRVITVDMQRLGRTITCTCTGSPSFNYGALAATVFGSTSWANGMTVTGSGAIVWGGRSGGTITNNGATYSGSTSGSVNCVSGTYTLQDAMTATTAWNFDLTSGTADLNGQTVTGPGFSTSGSKTRTLTGGAATWNIGGTVAFGYWSVTGSNVTISMGSSTIVWTAATTNTRTFTGLGGAGITYGSLTYTVANSPGILSITGNNTWAGTWNIGPGRIVQCPSGGTQTFTAANALGGVAGASNGYVYLPSSTAAAISAPDIAAYTGAGIIRGTMRLSQDSWSASGLALMAHNKASSLGWQFWLNGGFLAFQLSTNGSSNLFSQISSATGLVSGTTYWVGWEYDTAVGTLTFYKANDQVSEPTVWSGWTQISTHALAAGVPFDSTATFTVGNNDLSGGNPSSPGRYYRAKFYTSTSTVQYDADFTTKPFGANTFTESSSNAATVTINGALAQAGDGRVTLQAAATTTTFSVTGKGEMSRVVADHVTITQDRAVFAYNSVDGGSNTRIYFVDSSLSGAETGTGADASSVTATLSDSDSGSGADAAGAISTSSTDTGSGADAGSLAAAIASTETSTGADAGSLTTTLSSTETGAGADAAALVASVTDAELASAVDAGSLVAALSDVENGAGDDEGFVSAVSLLDGETATGADDGAISGVSVTDAETGSGADAGAVSFVTLADAETAVVADAESIVARLAAAELGVGLDDATASVSLTDGDVAFVLDDGTVLRYRRTSAPASVSAGQKRGTVSAGQRRSTVSAATSTTRNIE